MSDNRHAAPLPRDYDQASFSELVPLRSSKIRLLKSPLFYFALFTAVVIVAMFNLFGSMLEGPSREVQVSSFNSFVILATVYLLTMTMVGIHSYARTDRTLLYYVWPFLFVSVVMETPIGEGFRSIFHRALGGAAMIGADNIPTRFLGYLLAAGLNEELQKALPTLLGAALTIGAARFAQTLPPRVLHAIRVRGPLDAILMGVAAGAAFTLWETAFEYVPRIAGTVLRETHGNLLGAFGAGIALLLPRTIGALIAHIGYSSIFAYFIGLAVIRQRQWLKLMLIGWAVSALVHATWDTFDGPIQFVIAGLAGSMLVASLLKARQLEATLFGRSRETFGSIIVDTPQPAAAVPRSAGSAPAAPASVPAPAYTPPPPMPVRAPPTMAALALSLAGATLPLHPGATLDLGAEPALGGRGSGLRGEVTRHPTNPNVLGFRNLGATTWYARLRDDSIQPVEPQRNLRLAPGVSIDFGSGLVAQVVPA